MIPLLASLHPAARSIPKVHKQGAPTRKACTGSPEFKHLDSWALCALPAACLPRLTPLYPAPQHSSLQFAPGSHYCLLFLPFVCALSSMPFSPWGPMYVPTYALNSAQVCLLLGNFTWACRMIYAVPIELPTAWPQINIFLIYLFLLARGQEVHELSKCVPNLHFILPLPLLLDVCLETGYLTFWSQGGFY